MLLSKEKVLKSRSLCIMCCSGKKKILKWRVYISRLAQERKRFNVAESIYCVLLRKEEDLKFRSLYMCC